MSNIMHPDELIAQARADLSEDVSTLLEALEAFHGHGFSDESSGDVESPEGHFYRVHRWIVHTNEFGFSDVTEHDSEAQAEADFKVRETAFSEWGSEDE